MNRILTFIVFSITSIFLLTACNDSERQKANGEKIKGVTQASVGEVTSDAELINKGNANQTKGDLRSTKEDIKDLITGD